MNSNLKQFKKFIKQQGFDQFIFIGTGPENFGLSFKLGDVSTADSDDAFLKFALRIAESLLQDDSAHDTYMRVLKVLAMVSNALIGNCMECGESLGKDAFIH